MIGPSLSDVPTSDPAETLEIDAALNERELRILHVASGDLWAGAEAQAFTLIANLARIPRTIVMAVVLNEGVLAERLRAAGIPVAVFDEQTQGPIRILINLKNIVQKWKADVVHTHRAKENVLGAVAARLAGDVLSVRTVHGASEHQARTLQTRIRRRTISALDSFCARRLQRMTIAVSAELGARLASEQPASTVAVIENGVDAVSLRSQIESADFRLKDPDATHLGCVGRLVEVKRVDLFLETAALLQREASERKWRFHVFGDGPLHRTLHSLAKRLGIERVTTFHGHRSDIASCIASLDLMVMCSDHEGMPMTALEAAALRVPLVCHAVGALPAIVPEQLLVSRHDANGYKEAALRALSPGHRQAIRDRADEVTMKYSSATNAKRIRALYQTALAHGSRR